MAFRVVQEQETSQWVRSEESLWLDADREKIVAEDDPRAAFLFATPSDRISMEDAEWYGLIKSKKAASASEEASPAKSAKKK